MTKIQVCKICEPRQKLLKNLNSRTGKDSHYRELLRDEYVEKLRGFECRNPVCVVRKKPTDIRGGGTDDFLLGNTYEEFNWFRKEWESHSHKCVNCGTRYPENKKDTYAGVPIDPLLEIDSEYPFVWIKGESIPSTSGYINWIADGKTELRMNTDEVLM